MKPTIGRIVHYTLSDQDAARIRNQRVTAMPGTSNNAAAGDVYPATIVRTWGDTPESAVNLQVHLDGVDTYWATSRTVGEGEGHFAWPVRVA